MASRQGAGNKPTTINPAGLQLLFQRPNEPLFTPKGDGKIAFDVPDSYLPQRYQSIGESLNSRIGADKVETKITLRKITTPDLDFARDVPKDGGFSLFNDNHRKIAGQLVKVFTDQPDFDSFVSAAAFSKDLLNPFLFQYALSVAAAHRTDAQNIPIPTAVQIFPNQFVDPAVFKKLREEAALVEPSNRQAVEIPFNYTASDREEEQRLAYFREDIGVNMHHWHWHLVYPGSGELKVIKKDRRGELFFYMHNQIIARYNTERFSSKLARIKFLSNLREVVPEGYFPKMIRSNNNRGYPPRFTRTLLSDINRNDTVVEIADLERWRDRIHQAIDQGFVIDKDGNNVKLTEETGIDILGDLVEATDLSINPDYYGSLHNQGHNVISFCHDPDNRHLEDFGVMGDVTTAMRDPVFYRWHGYIDAIFLKYKKKLKAYTDAQLNYSSVTVQSVDVQITRGKTPPNSLLTYWQKSQVDLGAGLDFGAEGNMLATFTHLNHAPFEYRINVNNEGAARKGTCRIFLGPKTDERGIALPFADQRTLLIEMDKFTVNLNPGVNTIVRRSDQSSVTIPFEQTFRRVGVDAQPKDPAALALFRYCGCGWPHHLLVPRGTKEGMSYDLFVMISNFADDDVNQAFDENEGCNSAASFCGARDKKYPDKRSMGYPFDRVHTAKTLKDFVNGRSNMKLQNLNIRFADTIVTKP